MRSKPSLTAWALLGVLTSGALILGLPRLLRPTRPRPAPLTLPPLSSLPPMPVPTAAPPPSPSLSGRLGQALSDAPLLLPLEVAARTGDYLYWAKFEVHQMPRAETIPVLRHFLDDPDVFVRMRAAQMLAQVGDNEGDAVLWQIAYAPAPIMVNAPGPGQRKLEPRDLRGSAIYSLATRGVREMAPLCARHFQETGRLDFAVLAAELGDKEVIPALLAADERQLKNKGQGMIHVETFGRAKVQEARPLIEARFNNVYRRASGAVKNEAAWAMIQLGERGIYYDYLLNLAKITVDKDGVPFSGDIYADARDALKYVATVHTPEVQALLESALEVSDYDVRQIALANLLMGGWNPPSEVARQKLIYELDHAVETRFSWQLLLELAGRSTDAQVRAAAARASAGHPEDRETWRKAREEWVHWPHGYLYGLNMVR